MSIETKNINIPMPSVSDFEENKDVSNPTHITYPSKESTGSTIVKRHSYITESYTREKKEDLTDYIITEEGIVTESWHSIINIPSQIIEVTEEYVKLECIFNLERKEYGYLEFDLNDLIHLTPLMQHKLVLIKIFKRPGVKTYKILSGDQKFERNLFQKDFFQDLDPSIFSEQL
jgi:hypothetical protein